MQEAAQRVENLAQGEPDRASSSRCRSRSPGPGLTQMFLGGAVSFVTGLVVMIALLFFLLASGDTLLRQAVSIAPRLSDKRRVVEIARDTEDDISYYLLTISLINAGLGVAVGIAMYLLGMPNAMLWGVMAGVFNFVPFLGAVVGIGIVGAGRAADLRRSSGRSLLPPLTYLFLTSFEAQFVTPGAARPPPDPEPGRGVPRADRLDLAVGRRRRAARGAAARHLQDLLRPHRAAAADRHHARPLSGAAQELQLKPSRPAPDIVAKRGRPRVVA